MNKQDLRKKLIKMRDNIDDLYAAGANKIICKKGYNIVKNQITPIAVYIAIGHEVNLKEMIERLLKEGKTLCAPKVKGKTMEFYKFISYDDLKPGPFGVLEPKNSLNPISLKYSVVFVPGVAFGLDGSRIGYGAGYYDRYFAKNDNNVLIGVAYDFQINQIFVADEYDIKMNRIICNDL